MSPSAGRRGGRWSGSSPRIDIPVVHFSVVWWRGLHQGPTFGVAGQDRQPAAPGQFVAALLLMLGAFMLVWLWMMVTRYRLARLEWDAEEAARRRAAPRPCRVAPEPRGEPMQEPMRGADAVSDVARSRLRGRRLRRDPDRGRGVLDHPGSPSARGPRGSVAARANECSPNRETTGAHDRRDPGPAPAPDGAAGARGWWALAILAVIGWLAFSGVGNALVYYLTPTELAARGDAAVGQSVRLGGLVDAGSIAGDGHEPDLHPDRRPHRDHRPLVGRADQLVPRGDRGRGRGQAGRQRGLRGGGGDRQARRELRGAHRGRAASPLVYPAD